MAAGSRRAKGTISRRDLLSGALSAGLAGAVGPCLWAASGADSCAVDYEVSRR